MSASLCFACSPSATGVAGLLSGVCCGVVMPLGRGGNCRPNPGLAVLAGATGAVSGATATCAGFGNGRSGVVLTGTGSTKGFSVLAETLIVGFDLCFLTGLGVCDLSLSSLARDRIVGSEVGIVGLRFRPGVTCAVGIAAAAGCGGVFMGSTSDSLTTILPALLETLEADDVETEEAQSRSLFLRSLFSLLLSSLMASSSLEEWLDFDDLVDTADLISASFSAFLLSLCACSLSFDRFLLAAVGISSPE